jgi:hypothetical protein
MPEPDAIRLAACHLSHLFRVTMADDGGRVRTAPGLAAPFCLAGHNDVLHVRIMGCRPVQATTGRRGFQRLPYAGLIVGIHAFADFAADQHTSDGSADSGSGLAATLADLMARDAAQNATEDGCAGRGIAAINRLPPGRAWRLVDLGRLLFKPGWVDHDWRLRNHDVHRSACTLAFALFLVIAISFPGALDLAAAFHEHFVMMAMALAFASSVVPVIVVCEGRGSRKYEG